MNVVEKGKRGEREVAKIFLSSGFDAKRVPNSGGLEVKGDLTGVEGFHVEVKRQETAKIWEWLRQTEEEAGEGEIPLLVFRRNHREWTAALPLSDLLDLMDRAS